MTKTTILVTGGTGFIGQHLLSALPSYFTNTPIEIRVLDYEPMTRNSMQDIVFIQGDITKIESLRPALEGVRILFHLAGKTGEAANRADTDLFWRINVVGTQNVLQAAIDAGVKVMVNLSSSSIYGDNQGICDETTTPTPLTAYGKTKLAAEERIEAAAATTSMRLITLRPSDVFGENSAYNVLLTLMRAIQRQRFFLLRNQDNAHVNYLYIGDLIDAGIRLALTDNQAGTFNVNTPEQIERFATRIATILNTPSSFIQLPYIPVYVAAVAIETLGKTFNRNAPVTRGKVKSLTSTCVLDSTKLKTALPGWPRYGLVEGLTLLTQHYQAKELL